MSVDREQIRRSLERQQDEVGDPFGVCEQVIALLAELEQAERERDEAVWPRLDHWRERAQAAETRLAKVPALVEAAKRVHPGHGPTGFAPQVSTCPICAALAEWERG